ncbi:MAG: hypothetical protein KAT75_02255 [Dehalococcoidia bacterium]|nr:hypothetical protein [Dehalococcoidia bacterium]
MLHNLAARMRSGETLVGTWLYLNDAGVGEIVAGAGFDFVMIDMEHSSTGYQSVRSLLMSIEHHTAPVVRVKGNAPEFISAILDLGPAGVMVPRVQTAEQARRAVQCCKYHPLGQRGFGPIRVSDYGRQMNEFLQQANDCQMLCVQLEHGEALANIEEIVSVPGIDAFIIGQGDLSQSMGHRGEVDNPEVNAAATAAAAVIRQAGIPWGSAFGTLEGLDCYLQHGMSFFTAAPDFQFVRDGAEETLRGAREVLAHHSMRHS